MGLCEMAETGERNFPSQRRRKQKGFCGPSGSNRRRKVSEHGQPDVSANLVKLGWSWSARAGHIW